jgi:hypothetical protein
MIKIFLVVIHSFVLYTCSDNGLQSYGRLIILDCSIFDIFTLKLIKYNLYSEIISISIQSFQYMDGGY